MRRDTLAFPSMLLTLLVVMAGCAQPGPSSGAQASLPDPQTPAVKRITAAVMADHPTLSPKYNSPLPGSEAMGELVSAYLTNVNDQGRLRPQLAEAVPSTENGLWQVFPDGRMETTWRIRPTAQWHDGTPFTSRDLLFTYQVESDRDLRVFRSAAAAEVQSIEATDAHTVIVRWSKPYIGADTLFASPADSPPLPQHLLETAYLADKAAFGQHPYWTTEFVGTGPYRVREWEQGSRVRLEAFDDYVLGRPRIDEIEVRFIRDSNAVVANILAGEIDLTLGRTLSLEQALQVREQWRDGQVDVGFKSWMVIYPQFVNPDPPIVSDLRFRRALLHAIDRQQMVDSIVFGMVPVAHSFLNPGQSQFRDLEASLPRYEYDPRLATALIEGLGYRRGSDGLFRDSSGQAAEPLRVEIRTTGENDLHVKSLYPIADYWQRFGVGTDPVVVPPQRQQDREYRRTFPGFETVQNPNDIRGLERFHSAIVPLPETNFVGSNNPRYMNAEYDALVDRYRVTIPLDERERVIGQIVRHIAEHLPAMGLFYSTEPILIGKRLINATARKADSSNNTWNAQTWDVQ